MTNPAASILDSIQKYTIKGIPRAKDQVHPKYEGLSIANIPASICKWLDCPLPASKPLAKEISTNLQETYQHIILVLVDGLGLNFLRANHFDEIEGNPLTDWQSHLKDGLLVPLTSITPSTTSAALTTLNTGYLPVEHGILAYELFLKEFGLIANMITHTATAFPKIKAACCGLDSTRKVFYRYQPWARICRHMACTPTPCSTKPLPIQAYRK